MTILNGVRLGSWKDLGTCRYLSPQGAAGRGGRRYGGEGTDDFCRVTIKFSLPIMLCNIINTPTLSSIYSSPFTLY